MVQVFASRLKTAILGVCRNAIGVFPFSLSSDFKGAITDILHYYSLAHTEGPLRSHGEQVHTWYISRYTGIHSITVPILNVLLLLCIPPTHAIVPNFGRPIKYQDKHDRLSKSNAVTRYILIAPEKCKHVLICWATFPPQAVELGEQLLLAVICFRFGRTRVCKMPISLHQVKIIGPFGFSGKKNCSNQSCKQLYHTYVRDIFALHFSLAYQRATPGIFRVRFVDYLNKVPGIL